METGCDAAITWHRPQRFRRVCPLLKEDASGQLRCSANTPEVRPFWGRAVGYYLALAAMMYVVLAGAAFGLLRWRGYPVSLAFVLWPPSWSSFPAIQSDFFTEQAQGHLQAGRYQEALTSLQLAHLKNPRNHRAAFEFARLLLARGHPALSDRVYAQLLADRPDLWPATAHARYQSLLWRGDFRTIVRLARDALVRDPQHADAWTLAAIFALRREPDPATLDALAADALLPAEARAVFALEAQTSRAAPADVRRSLLELKPSQFTALLRYYQLRRLLDADLGQEAYRLLGPARAQLTARDTLLLTLRTYAVLKWTANLRAEVEALLAGPYGPVEIEALCAHLIFAPDPAVLAAVFAAATKGPSPVATRHPALAGALFCAAGAAGDRARMNEAMGWLRASRGTAAEGMRPLHAFFSQDGKAGRIDAFLVSAQPLPLDVTYALLERYYRPQGSSDGGPRR